MDSTEPVTALIAAGRFFASREVYGLVWIAPDLTARARYGSKAGFVVLDRPISESVIPFIGLEDYILSFQTDPTAAIELPGVVIHASGTEQRYNLSLFWSPDDAHYLLLIARASLDASLEIELLRQVRARLMAEAEILAKSRELARANRDLEDFASIISHDLKAPMRALRYMADDVELALNDASADNARAKLDLMRAQSKRLSSMLSALLDYSSIGRKSEAVEPVDTRALIEAVLASMPRAPQFILEVAGDWPVIDTLKAPLDLVLRNLAENAIKHHDRCNGHVTLRCVPGESTLAISVSDDGPGIRPEHRDAIFLPFRQIAMNAEAGAGTASEGVGMGLAFVKRTIESIGGALDLTSDPARQRGATFHITWPRQIAS